MSTFAAIGRNRTSSESIMNARIHYAESHLRKTAVNRTSSESRMKARIHYAGARVRKTIVKTITKRNSI